MLLVWALLISGPALASQHLPTTLRTALATHVHALAHDIGPRNSEASEAYVRASNYIINTLAAADVACQTVPMPDAANCPPILVAHFEPLRTPPTSTIDTSPPDKHVQCSQLVTYSNALPSASASQQPRHETSPAQPTTTQREYTALAHPSPVAKIPTLLLCAHYDSVPGSPGAGDNASGVAVLMETARALVKSPPSARVDIAFFPNEEEPYFMTPASGSFHYASRLAARNALPRHTVAVDSIGWRAYGPRAIVDVPSPLRIAHSDLIAGAREHSRQLADSLGTILEVASFVTDKGAVWIDYSDHAAFAAHGVPAALLGAWAGLFTPIIHSPRDTAEHLDFTLMENVVNGLVRYTHSLRPASAHTTQAEQDASDLHIKLPPTAQ